MQNEHGGESREPGFGAWSATGSEHGDDAAAASSAAGGEEPGPAGPGAPAAGAADGWNATIPFAAGASGQPGPYGYGSPGGQAPPPGGYGYGAPGGGYGPPHPGYAQAGGYGPADGYGPAGGYAQAGGPGQPGPPGGYGPGPGYGQGGGYGPPGGGYGPPGGYQPPGGYGMPGDYLHQPPPPRRRMTGVVAYIAVAAVAAAAGAGTVLLADTASHHSAQQPPASSPGGNPFGGGQPSTGPLGGNQAPAGSGNVSSSTEQSVKAAIQPGVVDLTSNLQYQGGTAAATGMVISKSGIVLTNNHVIEGSTGLTGRIVATGQHFAARYLGYNKSDDVAVLQLVGASGLKTVPLGNSSSVKVGDGVIALGNAGGTGGTITVTGSITGLNQSITASDDGSSSSERLTNMLRTDADIVPGDSGGPLASTAGKVIGMNTAAATGSFGAGQQSNVGFAIPINRALSIARQIINGRPSSQVTIGSTGFLGVLVPADKASQVASPAQQRQLQIQGEANGGGGIGGIPRSGANCLANNLDAGIPAQIAPASSGALVLGELCGTPASAGGIVPGDVITAVGGQPVTTPASLTGIMAKLRPGSRISVTWVTLAGGHLTKPLLLIPAPPQ